MPVSRFMMSYANVVGCVVPLIGSITAVRLPRASYWYVVVLFWASVIEAISPTEL